MRNVVCSVLAGVLILASSNAEVHASCKNPRVLVVLDKSSSMLGMVDGESKWQIAKDALASVLGSNVANVDFGLMVFPNPSQCGPGAVKVPVGPTDVTKVMAELATPPAAGNWTPIAQSLDVIPSLASFQDAGYARHVLLITDGWQWCDPYDKTSRFLPVNAVTTLTDLGITTHVVGFGGGVDALTLNKMAAAADTKAQANCDASGSDPAGTNNCYYQANDPKQLLAALESIAKIISQEVCDGLDNDCNGALDDSLTAPGCDKIQGVCKDATQICQGLAGWSNCSSDVYRIHAKSNGTTYQSLETLCDGQDNDCDGTTDEGCSCVDGTKRPCGSEKGQCAVGLQICSSGTWSECFGEVMAANETCDGLDNDCDGKVDENLTRSCSTVCGVGSESCTKGLYVDCTAPQPSEEICDGLDNDCDGTIDDAEGLCAPGSNCVNGHCLVITVPAGCDCSVSASGQAPYGLALLGLGFLFIRRRRSFGKPSVERRQNKQRQ